MLKNDSKAEQQLIKSIRERIDFVKQNKDHGSDELLKDFLEDHERIAYEIHHYLQNESLEWPIKSNILYIILLFILDQKVNRIK